MAARPLLIELQHLIERTYDLDTGLADIAPFIIGDAGYAIFYEGREVVQKVGSGAVREGEALPTARTLVREEARGVRVALYYPDRLVENLERHDPARHLGDDNVDDFATLVEELDHFLVIADRHRARGTMTLLELELHANVTKALTLEKFVARLLGAKRLAPAGRGWVRHHLFDKNEYCDEDPDVRARYRHAASLAVKYLDHLQDLPAASRPRELRLFHRRSHQAKIEQISRL
jgi:hypothetical protein